MFRLDGEKKTKKHQQQKEWPVSHSMPAQS